VGANHPRVLYIWFVTIAAGFGAVIGALKAVPFVRRQLRTLVVPSANEGSKLTPPRAADGRSKNAIPALPTIFQRTGDYLPGWTLVEQAFICAGGVLFCDNYIVGGGALIADPFFTNGRVGTDS
jgi:hypothetical protein